MKLAIGSDHAGFDLKSALLATVRSRGIEVVDFGCSASDACDHSDISIPVAQAVAAGECDGAVLICGSGQGMTIGANKVRGIRATLCLDAEMAKFARAHNDSNVLVLAGRLTSPETAAAALDAWVVTSFDGGRHADRMDKILEYERHRDASMKRA